MKIKIKKSIAKGRIKAPPSKSYAHRLLIASALSNGESQIEGIIDSKDMQATLSCLGALGVGCSKKGDDVSVFGGNLKEKFDDFNCLESGSTLRFFIPIALALNDSATFVGTERLMSRGLEVYDEICKNQGIKVTKDKTSIKYEGKLMPDTFYVRGDISSQFITGLLFALPMLSDDSKIVVTTKLESEAYVDITIDALKTFGIEIKRSENEFYIRGNQKYKSQNVTVEGDASNSAFLDAFNILGGDVSVLGLKNDTLQADYIYKKHFKELEKSYKTIDLSNTPDLAPICFAIAASKNGAHFVGTKRLKIKESDRAEAMASELRKLGAEIEVYENEVIINPSILHAPTEALYGHNDHRIVMSLAVLLSTLGGTIDGCEAVSKSYPSFFDDIHTLGISFEEVAE